MKKLFGVLVAAVMLAGGLVAFAMSPASAACPYTGCAATYTTIIAPDRVERGSRARICVRVTTDGNATPKGRVTLAVIRSRGGFRYTDNKAYDAPRTCFRTPRLRKLGRYVISAKFDRKPGSGFRDSDNRDVFRVVR